MWPCLRNNNDSKQYQSFLQSAVVILLICFPAPKALHGFHPSPFPRSQSAIQSLSLYSAGKKKTHRKLFMFGSASTMNEMAGLCILEWSHPQISSHGWTFLQCHYGVWSCHCQQPWVSSRKRWARRNPFLLSGAQSMKISNGLELLSVDSSKETQSKGLAINLDVEEHSGVWPWMIANSNRGQWHLQSDGRFLGVFFLYSYESS